MYTQNIYIRMWSVSCYSRCTLLVNMHIQSCTCAWVHVWHTEITSPPHISPQVSVRCIVNMIAIVPCNVFFFFSLWGLCFLPLLFFFSFLLSSLFWEGTLDWTELFIWEICLGGLPSTSIHRIFLCSFFSVFRCNTPVFYLKGMQLSPHVHGSSVGEEG